jgi:dephospho-CoA kinase
MIRAGVTGGIGSGKSTLCKVWEQLGARVVYADDLAKTLMVENEDVKSAITHAFGEGAYFPDGSLNKAYLIEEAFEKGRVEELNRIVHPAVRKAFTSICDKAKRNGEQIVVQEAALLLNEGRPDHLDKIVLVTGPQEDRVNRVVRRDQTGPQEVLARIQKQPDFHQLSHLVDYVVENDGTLEEFKRKSTDLFYKMINTS